MQDRIINFVTSNSNVEEKVLRRLMMNTKELVMDVGSVVEGEKAVEIGLIDRLGGLSDAIESLYELIEISEKRYSDYTYVSDSRFTYHYRRLIFKGVELDELAKINLQAYCVGNLDYDKPACDMVIYDSHIEMEPVSLKDYLPAKAHPDLQKPPYVNFD
jgi:hypothetical protein